MPSLICVKYEVRSCHTKKLPLRTSSGYNPSKEPEPITKEWIALGLLFILEEGHYPKGSM